MELLIETIFQFAIVISIFLVLTIIGEYAYKLKKKYEWLEGMNIKGIQYNNKNINFGQNCLQIGLQRGSKLNILFN